MKYNANISLIQRLPEIVDFSVRHQFDFSLHVKNGISGALFCNRLHLVEFLDCTVENYLETYFVSRTLGMFITGSEATDCCNDLDIVPIERVRSVVANKPAIEDLFEYHASRKSADLYSSIVLFDALMSVLSQSDNSNLQKLDEVKSCFRPLKGGLRQRYEELITGFA